jgi:hypothetical protein
MRLRGISFTDKNFLLPDMHRVRNPLASEIEDAPQRIADAFASKDRIGFSAHSAKVCKMASLPYWLGMFMNAAFYAY